MFVEYAKNCGEPQVNTGRGLAKIAVPEEEAEKEQAGERGAGESRDKRSLKRNISQASSAVSSATIDDDGEEDSENVKEEVVALRDSYIKKGVEKADSENGEEDSDEIDVLDEFLEAPSKDDQWVAMTVSHTKKKPIEKTELTNGEAIAKDEVAKAKSIDPSKRRAQAMQIAKKQPREGCLTADTRGPLGEIKQHGRPLMVDHLCTHHYVQNTQHFSLVVEVTGQNRPDHDVIEEIFQKIQNKEDITSCYAMNTTNPVAWQGQVVALRWWKRWH